MRIALIVQDCTLIVPPVATQTMSFLCYLWWEIEEHICQKSEQQFPFA